MEFLVLMVMISEIACGKAGRPWPSYWEGHGIRGKKAS
jgi:hypothetical protein